MYWSFSIGMQHRTWGLGSASRAMFKHHPAHRIKSSRSHRFISSLTPQAPTRWKSSLCASTNSLIRFTTRAPSKYPRKWWKRELKIGNLPSVNSKRNTRNDRSWSKAWQNANTSWLSGNSKKKSWKTCRTRGWWACSAHRHSTNNRKQIFWFRIMLIEIIRNVM